MKQRQKYYHAYEDRYKRVYSQGIEYWTNDPIEIKASINKLGRFLKYYRLSPKNVRTIEFGCGEGHLAQYLIQKGYECLGVNLSTSAIAKAKQRLDESGISGNFLLGDVTHLDMIADESYDVGIDNFCLQMLVLDVDRHNYLSEITRILTKQGKAFFREIYQEELSEEEIKFFDEYMAKFKPDLKTLEDCQVYTHGQYRKIKLPRIPARFNNEMGYRKELMNVRLIIDNFQIEQCTCVIYATK